MATFLILLGIGLLIASAVVFFKGLYRTKNTPQRAWRDPAEFAAWESLKPSELGPGAIVGYGGVDYVVRGTVTMRQEFFEEGESVEVYVWWEHLLEGGDEPIWLSVEVDDGLLKVVMWTRREDFTLTPYGQHVVDGETFREVERGSATYTTEGTTGLPASGAVEYVDYANPDGTTFLGFERWAPEMPREISIGRAVQPAELTVYPAPPPST